MLVLASRSPRRAELLAAAGFEFTVRAAAIDESARAGEHPHEYALRVAEEKAVSVESDGNEIVLAADTIVLAGSEIMGKPKNASDARRMLETLSGSRHEVITGICLKKGSRHIRDYSSTAVWFAALTSDEIAWYIASGEPMDKAGAYGIQGLASRFIERIEGSYSNVVGLPVAQVYRLLAKLAV